MNMSIAIRTVSARRDKFHALLRQLSKLFPAANVYVSADETVTPNENGCLALEASLQDNSDWTLFLEDDAGLPDNFAENLRWWFERYVDSDVHVYPLGCQYAQCWTKNDRINGAWDYPLDAFYCSVAMLVRSNQIPSLVNYIRCSKKPTGVDIWTARWHKTVSPATHLRTPVPSLVEHLGDESTLVDTREGKNVVGRFAGFGGWNFRFEEQKHG